MTGKVPCDKKSNLPRETKKIEKGGRDWPTVNRGLTFWLFLPAVSTVVGTTLVYWLGWISLGAASVILIPGYFFLAMCVHDAIHRAAHSNPYLNRTVGWIAAGAMALPFPTIRRTHLNHHASLGHQHDDEGFIYRSALTLPLRLLCVNWRCYGALWCSPRRERLQAGCFLSCVVAVVVWNPQPLLWGWLFPMQLGVAVFALLTVYLPHGPFRKWVMQHVPAVTGFHDDHHARPQLPWYQLFKQRSI